ncbi:DEAD/DEAH box helicase family protein [Lihuaxuella thermophila]|uniref:Superfamily II DNA or RNA helicase n=1 Tax=Lihuaxuella thermophila TaxID=1173111 RepID=A0A1H8CEC9_9BACL|nr:DEAD/DEAH box helicase family protein [Lihuaxuella thermophila]SEM93395.1 Superfamily II DNA or RNA helicase [Lihuaxuella thermophila]
MSRVRLTTSQLYPHLIQAIEKSDAIYILVSFIMASGASLLHEPLERAAKRGADIKICTGDYLYITSPIALEQLLSIEGAEIRLFRSLNQSFHAKAYLFRSKTDGFIVIGSSNLSNSALTSGIEWNLSVSKNADPEVFEQAFSEFMAVFHHEQTIPVNLETLADYRREYTEYHKIHPVLPIFKEEIAESRPEYELDTEVEITPHEVQKAALDSLLSTMEEGYKRAMIIMATGLGKTYLSAFFAQHFNKVLFIAHREEILRQAERSFLKVDDSWKTGFYYGSREDRHADVLFASIQKLSMKHHLTSLTPDEFDLIIVDEFHHASANSYRKVIDYFKPRFLLGMTATPDRLDGGNIYALCENNVAFQMHFIEAIERGFLVPFHYMGVYDEIDYSKIRLVGGHYDRSQLEAAQIQEKMADNIYQAWKKYRQTRTIAFCSTIRQAQFLSDYFNRHGERTIALHSKSGLAARSSSIKELEEGRMDVIFTVDLFNEGVDIPAVDTLLFVRPTESISIFTQQIGRGLRLAEGKKYCQIIDLIGNYKNLDAKLRLFEKSGIKKGNRIEPAVPELCVFELDTKAIDFLEYYKKNLPSRKQRLIQSYYDVKREIGRRPSYLELHLNGWEDSGGYRQEWGSYADFLASVNELSDNEEAALTSHGSLIREVEKTSMSKSYKMVLLKAMLQRGTKKWAHPVSPAEVAHFFHSYLTSAPYRRKIDGISSKTLAEEYDERKVAELILKMPMSKWAGSTDGNFLLEDGRFFVNGYQTIHSDELYQFVSEICEYRLHRYFEKKAKRVDSGQ